MKNRTEGERGWGLAAATRALLENAGPAEARGRDQQVDRAITSFLGQPAGSIALDDARADQLIILADHFGVDEAYFVDPDVAGRLRGRGRHRAPEPTGEGTRPPAGEPPITGAPTRETAARPRRALVGAVALAVLAGGVGGGLGYRVGTASDRPAPALAGTGPATDQVHASAPLREVVDKVLPSVAQLRVQAANLEAVGSGIVLTPDGLLLVSDHVIAPGGHVGRISVAFADGTAQPARVVGRNPASDLAVVAVENAHGLVPAKLGDPGSVRVGERVVAVGPLLSRGGVIASGVIDALAPTARAGRPGAPVPTTCDTITTDAAVSLDNSGAPLVDPHGTVVGVETVLPGRDGVPNAAPTYRLASAIPIARAAGIAEQLVDSSRSAPTVLGVKVGVGKPLALRDTPRGARVVAIVPGSPASAAALKPGDTVVELNGRAVTSGEQLVAATKILAPHDIVTVRLSDGRSARLAMDRSPAVASQASRRQSCAHACTALPEVSAHPAHPQTR